MIRQKTIKNPVLLEGLGLQTGSKTKVVLKDAPADSGINFIRADLPDKPLVSMRSFSIGACDIRPRRTTLKQGRAEIQTTEHLLSALFGLGINNLTIEIDGIEPPALDGSAREYVEAIEDAGIIEQDAPVKEFFIKKAVWLADNGAFLAAFPHHALRISYFLSYPVRSIGEQFLSLEISNEIFKKEIAPARTFCMAKEALLLRMLGFGKGANFNNTLIMGPRGPLKNSLRFPDEPVRHKMLDLIGDLSIIGMFLKAHIVAVKSGHALNIELVKKLKGGVIYGNGRA